MPGPIFVRPDQPVMQPDEVRALRGELGWTQEQLAGAVGVSALEVSAWEAGAVSVLLDDAAALAPLAWRARRERAYAAAGAWPCTWGQDVRARIVSLRPVEEGEQLREALDLMEKHEAQCAACRRASEVERALPRAPDLPLPLSVGGLAEFVLRTTDAGERLPVWLRMPVQLGIMGAWVVLVTLVLALLRFIVVPEAGFEPLFTFLQTVSIFMCWLWAAMLWDEVYPSQSYLARFLKAATTAAAIIAMAMRGMDPLEQSGVGFMALMGVCCLRALWWGQTEPQPAEQNAPPATAADPGALPGLGVEPDLQPNAFRTPMTPGAASTGPASPIGTRFDSGPPS